MMKRTISTLLAVAAATLWLTAAAQAAEFGFEDFDQAYLNENGSPATQAGSHPFALVNKLDFNTMAAPPGYLVDPVPVDQAKDLRIELPAGQVGAPSAVPRCPTALFLYDAIHQDPPECAPGTQVGVVEYKVGSKDTTKIAALYNLPPPPGVAAKLGFGAELLPVTIDVGLNQAPPYSVVSTLADIPQPLLFFGSRTTIWGVPADPVHDAQRGFCLLDPGENLCSANAPKLPFLNLPTACLGPVPTFYRADSWQNPGVFTGGSVLTHDNAVPPNPQGFSGCGKLEFSPRLAAEPSSRQAETGTGLDVNVDFDDEGQTNPEGLTQSTTKEAVLTLPEGVTINPSAAEGLGVCTPAEYARETVKSVSGEGCPNASKLGTLHIDTPLVEEPVEGQVFLAQQDDPATTEAGAENPFDSLIALYLILKNPSLGVLIRLPLKVEPDPQTGQLVTTLKDIPQLPFSHFNFHFREGARAPLITPSACGTYTTEAKLYPWSNPTRPLVATSSFEITSGVGGGPCPAGGVPPFHPHFEAGSINNNAGSFSPFNMRLIRSDGEQDMTKFSSTLPPGEIGSLVGVSKCPDAAVAMAKSKSGRQELGSPSCPAGSLIGHTLAGAGVGGSLTYVPGRLYLAGPYKGDPLSVISVTPAVAGPFDAGTVVVRLALNLNPKTAEVEVDGAASDPIPHILKGIVLKVRDLRVYVDRPNFTLNPTSCEESSAKARLFGSYLNAIDPADDVAVDLSSRYQAANCLNLGFKPKLSLKLKGGTKRGGHPGLIATYKPRRGDANVKGLVVRLPRSAFLDQAHIRTICTRVQFAAKACPQGAQYGFIKAWTPLLEEPLEGPVYLRSSNHKLPDLVFDLHGLVDIEVATRIDSANGGIRASLESLPDAPLSKVLLRMQGAKKGLIVNSRNLCGAKSKADVQLDGQNGKEASLKPVMQADCGGKRGGKPHSPHHRR